MLGLFKWSEEIRSATIEVGPEWKLEVVSS